MSEGSAGGEQWLYPARKSPSTNNAMATVEGIPTPSARNLSYDNNIRIDHGNFAERTFNTRPVTSPSYGRSPSSGSISPRQAFDNQLCLADSTRDLVMTRESVIRVDSRRPSFVNESSNSCDTTDSVLPDSKIGIAELCPVCGDKVSGYHYGLLTCESCKGFFKRTVQNKKVYSCIDNQVCQIDKSQRKRCPSCRFQKCIQVGMKVEAVRTDRMRGGRNKFGPLYKRDRAIKMQAVQKHNMLVYNDMVEFQHGDTSEDSSSQLSTLSGSNKITFHYGHRSVDSTLFPNNQHSFVNTGLLGYAPEMRVLPPLARELQDNEIDSNEMRRKILGFAKHRLDGRHLSLDKDILLFGCEVTDFLLLILVEWSRTAVYFKDCNVDDQMKILQSCWSELLVIEFVYSLMETDSWPMEILKVCGGEDIDNLIQRLNLSEMKDRLMDLVKKLRELQFDNIDYSCLKYLILLNPDITNLEDKQLIEKTQEKINATLFDYSISFFSQIRDKFGQLLLRLPEVRLISIRLEEFLYFNYLEKDLPRQSLLVELLLSKKV